MEKFTTTDLLEIETLLISFGKCFIFTPMFLVKDRNELLINDLSFKTFLDFIFPERYSVNDKTIAVDFNIFKILQLRYFRDNESVQIKTK